MPQCYSNVNDSCANNYTWDRIEMNGLGLWKICQILCETALNYIRKPPVEIIFIHHMQSITENSESSLCIRMKKYVNFSLSLTYVRSQNPVMLSAFICKARKMYTCEKYRFLSHDIVLKLNDLIQVTQVTIYFLTFP